MRLMMTVVLLLCLTASVEAQSRTDTLGVGIIWKRTQNPMTDTIQASDLTLTADSSTFATRLEYSITLQCKFSEPPGRVQPNVWYVNLSGTSWMPGRGIIAMQISDSIWPRRNPTRWFHSVTYRYPPAPTTKMSWTTSESGQGLSAGALNTFLAPMVRALRDTTELRIQAKISYTEVGAGSWNEGGVMFFAFGHEAKEALQNWMNECGVRPVVRR